MYISVHYHPPNSPRPPTWDKLFIYMTCSIDYSYILEQWWAGVSVSRNIILGESCGLSVDRAREGKLRNGYKEMLTFHG